MKTEGDYTTLAPKSLKGTMMGLLYLSLTFSGYFAGKLAEMTSSHVGILLRLADSVFYAKIALACGGGLLILWASAIARGFLVQNFVSWVRRENPI